MGVAAVLWNTFGAHGIRRRAAFETRRRFSRLAADAPAVPQAVLAHQPGERWPFRPNVRRLFRDGVASDALVRADRVLSGEYQAYRTTWRRRPSMPHEWNVDLETGYRYDADAPWFRIPHATPGTDIKDAWEPGRFAWAYDLARAWMLARNDRYAQAFWFAFEEFRAGCPPFRGVQWACGQETAIRAIALLWCEAALADAPSTTATRQDALRETIYLSGHRISDALDYALSQRNNHGISECTGLLAIGERFRAVDPTADGWWQRARAALEQQVLDQFAADGWYAQHSFTYLRVALDQLVTAARVLRATGDELSGPATARIREAVRLLARVVDESTGDVPNHGANDGAFVLPLTTREFRDFRPSLTAASATFQVPLPWRMGCDAEVLAWLDSDPPPTLTAERAKVMVGASGWLDARTGGTRVFARAGRYRSRPSHVDVLHLDVWIGGAIVAADPGTYRYTAGWSRALAEEHAHNTVTIEGFPMAKRGPRFLWLRWPRAVIASYGDDGDAITMALLNESWTRAGIRHRRTCRVAPDAVTVLDEVSLPVSAASRVALHWLIDGARDEVRVVANAPTDVEVHRGEEGSPYGWIADSYAVRRPATSVRMRTSEPVSRVSFATGFGSARSDDYLRGVLTGGVGIAPEPITFVRGGSR